MENDSDLMTKDRIGYDEDIDDDFEEPHDFAVVILNDNYSSFELVTAILRDVFHHDEAKAAEITRQVHEKGEGVAGVFSLDIAETKRAQGESLARKVQMPLKLELREI